MFKIRNLTKLQSKIVLSLVLAVNIICLLSIIAMQSAAVLRPTPRSYALQADGEHGSTVSHLIAVHPTPSITKLPSPQTSNLSLSPAGLKKIDNIHSVLNLSRSSRETIYPARRIGRYLLLDPNLCSDVKTVNIIIIVHTAPKNLMRRQRIRDTFAKRSLFYPFDVRVAFLLGKTLNTTLERLLWIEHVRYNDTVMGDFIDDYHNLTLKGVMGYGWVSQYCPNAEFVLKIDDDVLINTYKLLYTFLGHMRGKNKSIFCNHWHKDTMPILRTGKWRVEERVFAKMKTFPYDYCSGFIVLLTTDLMGPMHQAALTTPFFWIDDVYLFGMLPNVVGGVRFHNYRLDQQVSLNDQKAINCTTEKGAACQIFGTMIRDANYWKYWNMVTALFGTPDLKVETKLVA